jgi:hypothetical protein
MSFLILLILSIENMMTNPAPLRFTTASGTPIPLASGSNPKAITLADFNNDKILDLLVGNGESQNGTASVFLGNGAGSFARSITLKVNGSEPEVAATGDFNRDGFADIVTANETIAGTISIFLGNGSGAFSATPSVLPVGSEPHTVITTDVNRDGRTDLITANIGSSNVSILLGNGNGTFGSATNY